ncbi:MAG: amidase [Desulfobacteraceae bacterium]
MGLMNDYESYDAVELADFVRTGQIHPSEILEAAVDRIERLNPHINAVVRKMYDQAEKSIEKGLPKGTLQGVPFLLKDLGENYKGIPTSQGSRQFADYMPDHHTELVKRYKSAGLVILGKTNTPEFGLTITTEPKLFGPCRNPWNLEYTPGGSSGGAAAAVAAGMVPAAHGSDGGGSIRIPASCCGLFGLKPTRGRIPCGPVLGENWNGMSTSHVITRSVRDNAAFLDIASGPAPGDPYWAPPASGRYMDEIDKSPGRLTIAFTSTPPSGKQVSRECADAVTKAALLCESLGHHIEEARPEINAQKFDRSIITLVNVNVHCSIKALARHCTPPLYRKNFETTTWIIAEAGKKTSAAQYLESLQYMHLTGRKTAKFFNHYDILMSPVLLSPPVKLGVLDTDTADTGDYMTEFSRFFGFTNLFNATGQPSMSVPLYWTEEHLPVGIQFTAAFGKEDVLLRLASQLEQARPWSKKRPPHI